MDNYVVVCIRGFRRFNKMIVFGMQSEQNPFRLKKSREIYNNPWIRVREDQVIRPDGKDGIFGVVEMQSGVTVVALTPENDVFLSREYKYAVKRYTLECFSGGIDRDESTLDAAKRELMEESGAETESWTDLGSLDPFTGIILSTNHMYLAQNLVFSNEQNTDGGEIIDLIKVPFNEALEMVKNGEITHGASVVAILKTNLILNSSL